MKRAIYNLSTIALIAGTFLVACSTPDKKADADKTTAIDTTAVTTPPVAKTKTKLDKTKVPKEVTQLFYSDYPTANASDDNWYGYPTADYVNDWYDYDPDLYVNDNPDAYMIDFIMDSVNHKAIYTKAGKKIAVHKWVSVLPAAVLAAIDKGSYKTWTVGKEREEIFKNKGSDKLKVYKVFLSNADQKHIVYFESNGKLIKDKKVS